MVWTLEVSAAAERDIDLLFDHPAQSYVAFGESRASTADHASQRIGEILRAMERIATAPHRGKAHYDLLPGLRHLTLERTIYWYRLGEDSKTVQVLAIFYGGQDHVRRMLLRLLSDPAA